ncbi:MULTISPECIES: hypothetical protein [Salmonella]|nr:MULTISPECIES: hypothetical protein [Salmonella]ESF84704.1 hypothetical protein SEEPB940_03147 [Salmonella enterica subsp. enterica serovar Paratyphi B str. ATCC 19940]ESF91706.1 hypothetical protein SEEPB719_15396 [Salmonella enterica subsp. enterica serovar Paratyphi B str. ATCC 10719]MDJ3606783.1 hypothetical protein [Salmonella enterica]MDJ3628434.1 hypothetical protein [Salmonella enterica]MDJ3697071.1 hypothetical protein [Salmonella enterica]
MGVNDMLDGYFNHDGDSGDEFINKRKRLLAVQAALEIAKQSVGNYHQSTVSRVNEDLAKTADGIERLADAIQAALDK